MRRWTLAVFLIAVIAARDATACINIYVSVSLRIGSFGAYEGVWSESSVSCRDYFGNPWASMMYMKHLIYEDDFHIKEGRYQNGYYADWLSSLFAVTAPDHCYRGYAEGDDNLGTVQYARTAQACWYGPPDPCVRDPNGVECNQNREPATPLVVNLGGGAWSLTGREDAVLFDIDGDGRRDLMHWTSSSSSLAFVARDVNANGRIDDGRELLGDATLLPDGTVARNGFAALGVHDADGDRAITAADPIWSELLLWADANHNGSSEPEEIQALGTSGIARLELAYEKVGRVDRYGNEFRLMGHTVTTQGRRPYFDVFFTVYSP